MNISDFSLFFMKKLQTPPEKKSPPLSQQLPSPLNIEILASPPFLKICYEAQPPSPPSRKRWWCTLCIWRHPSAKQKFKDILLDISRRKGGKNAKKLHQNLILDYILVLVNSPKQPMNAKLLKQNDQKTLRRLSFALCSFMDKNMKRKRDLELVTSLSLGCLTCLEKFLF